MVVLMVTLFQRVTMLRPTPRASLLKALKATSAGILVLTAIIACGDYGTSVMATPQPDAVVRVPVNTVDYTMSDADKLGLGTPGGATKLAPSSFFSDVRSAPSSAASTVAAACGGTGFAGYTERRVDFSPEEIPRLAATPLSDDGWIPDTDVPIGFDFSFYGNTYNKVNIYMNGFLLFGPAPAARQSGSAVGGFLPSTSNPKNIIALAWTDWDPRKTPDGIRFETRGTAPNRKFIVQYNNVLELSGSGKLMGQIVLSEGSNDITLYTNSMNVTNSMHFVTQGIQNLAGTEAMYDSVQNVATGVWSRRVRNFFSLSNDAIRFSLISTRDDVKPTFDAVPTEVTQGNDPGLASAIVVLTPPPASDNCSAVTMGAARADGKALTDPYPVGTTTVIWTATDASSNSNTVEQTVRVIDIEDPTISVSDVVVNATTPSGAVVNYVVKSHDNVAVTSVVCDQESGTQFSIGPHTVSCTASDAAGHTATATFNVSVLDARTQLMNLIAYVQGLGAPSGTANPLLNPLTTALEHLGADNHVSCVKLNDFLAMIPKKGRQIPFDATSYMTAEATRIMTVLGCEMGPRALLVPGASA